MLRRFVADDADPQGAEAGAPLRRTREADRREPGRARPNPEPKRTEVQTFSLDELEAVAAELSPPGSGRSRCSRHSPDSGRANGWALERADVDRQAGVVTVRRSVVEGVVKPYDKTEGSLRALPCPLERRRRRRAPEAARHPRALPRSAWRAAGALSVAPPRVEPGASRGRTRASLAVRAPAHLCQAVDRRGRLHVRALPAHGDVAGDARQDLRAHAPGRARSRPLRPSTRSFGDFAGTRWKWPNRVVLNGAAFSRGAEI
jgi:hypothetical protein